MKRRLLTSAVVALVATTWGDLPCRSLGEGGNAFSGRAVKVSRDFGFDAADSTRFLQAALSSGAATVMVDSEN